MSEDIAFQIQLGVILPKMKETLTDSVLTIVEELAQTINAGLVGTDSVFPLEEAKAIFMKDFDIFMDRSVLPSIKEKYVQSPTPSDEGGTAPAD